MSAWFWINRGRGEWNCVRQWWQHCNVNCRNVNIFYQGFPASPNFAPLSHNFTWARGSNSFRIIWYEKGLKKNCWITTNNPSKSFKPHQSQKQGWSVLPMVWFSSLLLQWCRFHSQYHTHSTTGKYSFFLAHFLEGKKKLSHNKRYLCLRWTEVFTVHRIKDLL